jgi:hypothetical protein
MTKSEIGRGLSLTLSATLLSRRVHVRLWILEAASAAEIRIPEAKATFEEKPLGYPGG